MATQPYLPYIRYSYVMGQLLTVGFQFFGSIISFFEYNEETHHTKENATLKYASAIVAATICATIFSYTANLFQGEKITQESSSDTEHNDPYAYNKEEGPRTYTSNVRESLYLSFAALLTVTDNYFTIAALKAFLDGFQNPDEIEAILPLATPGIIAVILKTVLGDLPYNLTNACHEASGKTKKKVTGSEADSLVSLLIKPLAHPLATLWTVEIGTLVHTLWDFVGVMLLAPPDLYIAIYQSAALFWTSAIAASLILPPIFAANLIQTRYFEGEESRINLQRIHDPEHFEDIANEEEDWLGKLLMWWPSLRGPIHAGLYVQAPIHGMKDAMPIFVCLRHIITSNSTALKAGIIAPLVFFTAVSSSLGTGFSEVKISLRRYDALCQRLGLYAPVADKETGGDMNPYQAYNSDSDSDELRVTF